MNRETAKRILGNQPKYALRNMARALQIAPWHNSAQDWQNLEALRALGFKLAPKYTIETLRYYQMESARGEGLAEWSNDQLARQWEKALESQK